MTDEEKYYTIKAENIADGIDRMIIKDLWFASIYLDFLFKHL